jgi:hypothetical protein
LSLCFQWVEQIRVGLKLDGIFFFLANRPGLGIFAYILAKIYKLRRTSTLALRQRKAARLRQLAIPPDFLRASYVERFTTCGKANCACARGQKHGPFYYLASGLVPGHVLKFLLKTPAQQLQGQRGVAAYQQLWEGLEELSQINAELLRRGEPLQGE